MKAEYSRRCTACVFDADPVTGELIPRATEEIVSGSKVGVTLGAGLKIALFRRLSIRPELLLVDTTQGSGWNWGWVRLQSGETVNGRAEGWSLDGLRVRQGKNEITALAKSDIAQVRVVTGMSRGRKALIGFLVGGSVGVTTMAIDCAGHSAGSVCGKGSDKPVVFALVGAIGALIASLFPQHKRVIYAAPAR